MLMAPPLAAALHFGPPEYFALVLVGLTALSVGRRRAGEGTDDGRSSA